MRETQVSYSFHFNPEKGDSSILLTASMNMAFLPLMGRQKTFLLIVSQE